MKVWILCAVYFYQGEVVIGVYGSEELALKALVVEASKGTGDKLEIREYEVRENG